MAQVTSGKVLRETRERKGYDVNTVARRLRIRPDILRAIESGDFSSMPPRGYTRNMINAYARLLGLNPTEIVNMYLDEAYAYQVERARSSTPLGFSGNRDRHSQNITTRPRRSISNDDYLEEPDDFDYEYEQNSASLRSSRNSSGRTTNRRLFDDRTQYAHDDYGYRPERGERRSRSNRDYKSHHSTYTGSPTNIYSDNRRSRRERQIRVGQTPMGYRAPRFSGLFSGRLPLILGGIIIIALVVLVCYFIFGRGGTNDSDDVSQLPVSGINDTTGTEDGGTDEDLQVEVAPTAARIVYSVGEGDEVYLETYDNSTTPTAEILQGPEEKTVETTGVWTITTFTPDLVKVTVNGEPVTLESNPEYNGMYTYTVDFPAMLEEWRKTHTSRQSQRQAAVASAANAASNTNSSTDSANPQSSGQGSTNTQNGDSSSGQDDNQDDTL